MALKPRKKTSHKGQNGTVLIIGGSEEYIGAPTFVGMTALAVLRSGADLVTVAAPEKVAWAINCISPDLMTAKIKCRNFTPKQAARVVKLAQDKDIIELGNGIAFTPGAKPFLKQVITKLNGTKPLVLDAAALRVAKLQDLDNCVLLPHGGEWTTLLNNSNIEAKDIKTYIGTNTIVKKGHPKTTIISKNKQVTISAGNAGMTHGGTGDVLAGIITGLLAQGNNPFDAAKVAVTVNGKAADILYKQKGFGYLASDLIDVIPTVLKKYQKQI